MPTGLIDTATAPLIAGSFGAPATGVGKSFATLKAEVGLRFRSRSDAIALIPGWINDAYREMTSEYNFPELSGQLSFSTTSGQASYQLPSGVYTVSAVTPADNTLGLGAKPLAKVDETQYGLFDVSNDVPGSFFRYQQGPKSYLVLWPTPAGVHSLRVSFRVEPAPLVEETDCPTLDPRWHYCLVLRAKAVGFEALGEKEEYAEALRDYYAALRGKLDKSAEDKEGQILSASRPRSWHDLTRAPHF